MPGVLYPVKIGPVGVETTGTRSIQTRHEARRPAWLRQKGGLFLGQRSDAAFTAMNIARRWYTTYDPAYGRKVYPFIRDVALFWEDYLKFEPTPQELIKATENLPAGLRQPPDGRYVSYNDGANEDGQDTNPAVSLALARNALKLALDMSIELNWTNRSVDRWQSSSSISAPFPRRRRKGRTIFLPAEKALPAGNGRKPWDRHTHLSLGSGRAWQ